jgi:O-antigen/teichoic acid export membrane protein
MINFWIEKLNIFGFNKSVAYSFMAKSWLLVGGLVTTFLIAYYFSPEHQGYYYAFNSILILTVFAELGLSSVIVNFISHEWLHLQINKSKTLLGDDNSISRLTSLCHFAIRWFMYAAVIVTSALLAIGWFLWANADHTHVEWKLPWLALSIVTGLNLVFLPMTALLEGCNQVVNLYKYRLIQYIVSSFACWAAILMGAGLWAASISVMAGLLTLVLLTWFNYEVFLREVFFKSPKFDCINWRHDILPMQWRVALSWIGGYFTFALFVPVLFKFHGPVLAGQMGMTWTFVASLMSISSAWIAPHGPVLGLLVASKNYVKLDEKFKIIFTVNLWLVIIGSVTLALAIALLNFLNPKLGLRLLPLDITAIFLIGTIIYSIGLPMATYLRAHKREPLTKISILGGILNGVLVILLGFKYGAMGVSIAFALSTIITLPFLIKIFSTKRLEWH